MKLLTESLEGKALDWALAKARGADDVWVRDGAVFYRHGLEVCARFGHAEYEPFKHTDDSVCLDSIKGHIYKITHTHGGWEVFSDAGNRQFGESLEQAVARCVVAMQFGDEVDVPDELCVPKP